MWKSLMEILLGSVGGPGIPARRLVDDYASSIVIVSASVATAASPRALVNSPVPPVTASVLTAAVGTNEPSTVMPPSARSNEPTQWNLLANTLAPGATIVHTWSSV